MKRTPRTPEQQQQAKAHAEEKVSALQARVSQSLTDLSDLLLGDRSEAFLAYLRASAQFHHYSFNNQLLILAQAPGARQVAGFQTWKAVRRRVKKGAKGIAILRPRLVIDRDAPPLADGQQPTRMAGYLYTHVFADYDTEGEALPDYMAVQGDEQTGAQLTRLIDQARAAGVPVEYRPCGLGVYGLTDGGRLVLDSGQCLDAPGTGTRVFFHEWAHLVLHWAGEGQRAEDTPDRATRELEADAAAYALCSLHGVDARAQIADYVAGWGGNPEALGRSLTRVSRAVQTIMQTLSAGSVPQQDAA